MQSPGGDTEAMAGSARRRRAAVCRSFLAETVRDVPALHGDYDPLRVELALLQAMPEKPAGGLVQLEWIRLPILIGASVLLSWIVHRIRKVLRDRTSGQIATGILAASSKPLIIASVTGLVW